MQTLTKTKNMKINSQSGGGS